MPGLLSEHRLAGFLLVLALLCFAIGAGCVVLVHANGPDN